jgi:hypothetical protein
VLTFCVVSPQYEREYEELMEMLDDKEIERLAKIERQLQYRLNNHFRNY